MSSDIIAMARQAAAKHGHTFKDLPEQATVEFITAFDALIRAAERNKLAAWMIAQGYATGHGETMEGLLEELEREVGFKRAELWIKRINEAVLAEREECAKLCDKYAEYSCNPSNFAEQCAAAIRLRGQA